MQVRQQLAPFILETGMQVQVFHSSGLHLLATSRKARRLFTAVRVLGYVALSGVTSQRVLRSTLRWASVLDIDEQIELELDRRLEDYLANPDDVIAWDDVKAAALAKISK
jgi:hypothetical protein